MFGKRRQRRSDDQPAILPGGSDRVTSAAVVCVVWKQLSLLRNGARTSKAQATNGLGIAYLVSMLSRSAWLTLAPLALIGQTVCTTADFVFTRTLNLKPTSRSHIDLVRQIDGSYTAFEVTDTTPYKILAITPDFDRQLEPCPAHTVAAPRPKGTAPASNPVGVGSQLEVSTPLAGGKFFDSYISADSYTLLFDVFDSQHKLLSEISFTSVVSPPGYVGSANEHFVSLLLADLNGDNKLDLIATVVTPYAAGISYGGVWAFLGNGDGTFQPGNRQVLALRGQGEGAPAATVTAGDFNGDGKLDLVVTGNTNAALQIALGNGDGTFKTQTLPIAIPASLSPCGAAVGDLNRDGKADLVVTGPGLDTVAVLIGNGDGTFQPARTFAVLRLPSEISPTDSDAPIALGDLNGDGILDIATASGTILLGDGTGGFPTRKDYVTGASGSVMIADYDGDGKADILFGNGNPLYLSGSASYPTFTVLFGMGCEKRPFGACWPFGRR
jgi:FG-GAP-like repeat